MNNYKRTDENQLVSILPLKEETKKGNKLLYAFKEPDCL